MNKVKYSFPDTEALYCVYGDVCKALTNKGMDWARKTLENPESGRHEECMFLDQKTGIKTMSLELNTSGEPPTITFDFGTSASARVYSKLCQSIASGFGGVVSREMGAG